jgi:hypothetical protein
MAAEIKAKKNKTNSPLSRWEKRGEWVEGRGREWYNALRIRKTIFSIPLTGEGL